MIRFQPQFLFSTIILSVLIGFISANQVCADQRPNIVLIMCDDMGYEGVSIYGSETYSTPHLNELAKAGMYFEHCYSTPICTPSRVQIMTGLYNFRNYLKFGQLPITQKTFANHLRDAGYRTGICGKWQLAGDADTVLQFGFDTHCLWHLDGRESRYWNPRISRNGQLLEGLEDKFGPDIMTDFACDFLSTESSEPFFLYYPMTLPHWPFVPTPDSKPGGSRDLDGEYDGRQGGEEYFPDMVNYLDKLIGRIVTTLREASQLDNTLLIFTCDNGCAINITSEMKGREIKGGKASLPDNGTHVAMVAHWPAKFQQRGIQSQLVDFTDILPTLCDVAGLELDPIKTDGYSLAPVFTSARYDSGRQWVYCHYIRNGFPKKPDDQTKESAAIKKQNNMIKAKTAGTFVRNHRFKLYGDGRFYDISNDVDEKQPLSEVNKKTAAVIAQLQAVHDTMPKWAYFRDN
jgi:arylsulfatase A